MKSTLRGIAWVAGVYFYFLIFAQFSFLEILEKEVEGAQVLKSVMGAMALGGLLGSVAVLWLEKKFAWSSLMRVAALGCAVFPVLATLASGTLAFVLISLGIGLSLGVLTVLLSARLPDIMGANPYLGAGIGTGVAYMLSNLPWVFQSPPEVRSYVTAGAVFLLALLPLKVNEEEVLVEDSPWSFRVFFVGVICLSMLVWLDSAAFYIIQHNREIKLATWGEVYLWRNALVHLLVAILSGWLLLKGKMTWVLGAAFCFLGVAGLMASVDGLQIVAGYLYPAGVSLYSVALILYPSVWLGRSGATRRAVILFSVAGWIASAMGIGMAQDLNQVPLAFVGLAGLLMIVPWLWKYGKKRRLELSVVAIALGACFVWQKKETHPKQGLVASSLGHEIYLSEGCIHCHSRYVRPGSRDELLWGPARDIDELTAESPVIIGNRRQGPDLLQVGLRRSKTWMKLHFMDPESLSPGSTMPSYAYLFNDARGDALVDYLAEVKEKDLNERFKMIYAWMPSSEAHATSDGKHLFLHHCAMCHGESGRGDGLLAGKLAKPPANLVAGPLPFTSAPDGGLMISRVIKFGIHGTDMPGHELLTDSQIKSLVNYVLLLRKKTTQNTP